MTEDLPLSPSAVRRLLTVLNHPDHRHEFDNRHLVIESVHARAAALVRITGTVSGSDSLSAWQVPNATLRLALPEQPLEFQGHPDAPTTTSRVHTVAGIDTDARLLTIDLVRHAEDTPGMRWLARVRPGDSVPIIGPRPHRLPGPGSPRVLLADSSALPAALSILRGIPQEGETTVFAAAPADEIERFREAAEAASSHELHGQTPHSQTPRSRASHSQTPRSQTPRIHAVDPRSTLPLSTAFRAISIPKHTSVWAAGELEDIRALHDYCRAVLRLPAERVQTTGYWQRGPERRP